MKVVGNVSKMVVYATTPVSYELPLDEKRVPLNPLLGKRVTLEFTQKITCIACGITVKKSYQDGYCFQCTQKLARCDFCIIKPERCHFHLNTCREPKWGQLHCMIPHVVYLAWASGAKVGITRKTQIPTRWIDQGAIQAIPLFEVPNRRFSGLVEIALAKYVADKTNWRKMLSGQSETIDLLTAKDQLLEKMGSDLGEIYTKFGQDAVQLNNNSHIFTFEYPVLEYPQKIVSLSFDKTEKIEGTLLGIKGQYLIFESGVINMRKHSGYQISIFSS